MGGNVFYTLVAFNKVHIILNKNLIRLTVTKIIKYIVYPNNLHQLVLDYTRADC